jgi:hypothetical protein
MTVTVSASALGLATLIIIGLGGATAVCADEVRILSAAALQTAFPEIAREFGVASGHSLRINYVTIGAITQRVLVEKRPMSSSARRCRCRLSSRAARSPKPGACKSTKGGSARLEGEALTETNGKKGHQPC